MQIEQVKVQDEFWDHYRRIVQTVVVPYQWQIISDEATVKIERANGNSSDMVQQSHAIQNLKIAAGLAQGHFYGEWFQDSDVYKWLETVAYTLRYAPDPDLEQQADQVVALIGQAQQADGYLDTYFQIERPERRFKHISKSHELYCMGHYLEAGVAYFKTTGNQQALEIALKMADCLARNFGPEPGQLHGYPGHPELELALTKLAELTGASKYLDLAAYLIHQRGTKPSFFAGQNKLNVGIDEGYWPGVEPTADHYQDRVPLMAMTRGEGHAVRMAYLLAGATRVALLTHDQALLTACQRLCRHISEKQMYLTGGVGSTANGEGYTFDYDLPNDTMYCETCASCGMAFLSQALLQADPEGWVADLLETELYNGTISGMALDGQHYFYVNPLEVEPQACRFDPQKAHVKATRSAWLGCACCPPNLARLIASVDQFIYSIKDETIFSHLFIGNEARFSNGVLIKQSGHYPWSGELAFLIDNRSGKQDQKVAIHVPAWAAEDFEILNDGPAISSELQSGYLRFTVPAGCCWQFELKLAMPVKALRAVPQIKADLGKVALQRGPVVYCAEEVDNGPALQQLLLASQAGFAHHADQQTFGIRTELITAQGWRRSVDSRQPHRPYQSDPIQTSEPLTLTFIPYFLWANRRVGEMTVWLPEANTTLFSTAHQLHD